MVFPKLEEKKPLIDPLIKELASKVQFKNYNMVFRILQRVHEWAFIERELRSVE